MCSNKMLVFTFFYSALRQHRRNRNLIPSPLLAPAPRCRHALRDLLCLVASDALAKIA